MGLRRAKGTGTLYQTPKGLWVAQITYPSGNRATKTSKTQKTVRDWLVTQQNAIKQGVWVEDTSITFGQFLDRYLSDVARHTLRPKTLEAYEYLIRLHIRPEIGSIKLATLRPDQIQNFYSNKLDSGLSRRTVQFCHSIIHKALNHALKWGLVIRNVADLVEAPSVKRKAPHTLLPEQVRIFLNTTKEDRLYPAYVLAIATGLREGEILGLHFEDVDLKNGVIHVNHAIQYLIGKGLVLTEPKTDKARRSIKIPDSVLSVLKEFCGKQNRNQGIMFVTGNGTPFSPRNFVRHFKSVLQKAGLPDMRFHDLRHTTATLLLSEGVHPKVVQEMLGHSQINLTLDTYSHVLPSLQDDAAEKMNSILDLRI